MGSFFYKWLLLPLLVCTLSGAHHPIFVSVVEIEHNARDKRLELTCRIFTDDFEKTLREQYKVPVDLLKKTNSAAMDPLVSRYVTQHLKISVNGQPVTLKYLGFEPIEEAIYSYYEVPGIAAVQSVDIEDDILYSYKKEQISIIHVTVNGERKSTKLVNPERKAGMTF